MILNLPISFKGLLAAILFLTLATTTLQAQTDPVCEDGECPAAVLSIRLDAPLQGPITPERTEQFKTAYLRVKEIKNGLRQDPDWESDYIANEFGGKSCVRLNQLESHLAYEYERNPEFQQFIGKNEPLIQTFTENGFEGSRRALNLTTRMKGACSQELKSLERTQGPALEDLPVVYMKLGKVLGYFDEQGNMIKALKDLSADKPDEKEVDYDKLNKRKKVDYLKNKVAGLPIGPEQGNQISGLTDGLKAARPGLDQLNKSLKGLEPRFSALLPKPPGLSNKLETNKKELTDLKAFKPKNPKQDLSAKIESLLDKKQTLGDKTERLDTKADKLKNRYDKITGEFRELKKEVDQRIATAEKMQSELDDLEKKKADLVAKLDDKPKKILDELAPQVTETDKAAEDLSKKIESEQREKDKILGKLDQLIKEEAEVADELGQLEQEAEQLTRDQAQLEEDIKKLRWEAEEIKKQEAKADGLKKELAGLKSEDALEERISMCEEGLVSEREKSKGIADSRKKYEEETAALSKIPTQIVGKVADLKLFLNNLKLGYEGVPVTEKSLARIEQLIEKSGIIASNAEILTGKQTRLQQQIGDFHQNLEKAEASYAGMAAYLSEMRATLKALSAEKFGLQGKLDRGIDDLEQTDALVNDFMDRYNAFQDDTKCDREELVDKLQKEQAEIEQELKKLEKEMNETSVFAENLEKETAAADQEIRENTLLTKQLKQEEEVLKKEFGEKVALQAVPMEDWKESTQVERPYWEATAQADGELVRGFKGKYFEISLKDAEKNAKVLFAPGRYSLDKKVFRDNYGATLGSFVNEALLYLKQGDEGQVKLFIQGSADIAGQNTFQGRLDPDYPFEEITILPLDPDKQHFLSEPQTLTIPAKNFRNDDLPNLRAQYLKEIISAYTGKLAPMVLEGIVKDFEDKGERNAAIYLFFPEEMLERY